MKRKQVQLKVTTVGEPDICKLSESEQKRSTFQCSCGFWINAVSNLKSNPILSIIAKQQVDISKIIVLTPCCAKLCSNKTASSIGATSIKIL